MSAPRRAGLDHRLEGYFATLRSSSLRDVLKHSATNWQIYAAVTGSAMAMATGASAANIGSGNPGIAAEAIASVLAASQNLVRPKNVPMLQTVRLAMARQDSGERILRGAVARTSEQIAAPSISPGGVVPLDASVNTIQPGEWVSIYGTNLASGTVVWNGDFPTTLGGTSVEIDGKPAYLSFVSAGQINLQAPDDTAIGTVSVVVTTAAGSATSSVTLAPASPSFSLVHIAGGFGYVAGIIPRSNGTGAYGKGTYDILGPTGASFGYQTIAAQPGDTVELFAVGFGPTDPAVAAGKPFSGAAPIKDTLLLYINNVLVNTTWVGLSSAGLYQINLVVPSGLGDGDLPIQALIGGLSTEKNVLISVESGESTNPVTGGTGGGGGTFIPVSGGSFGGTGGGGIGGGTNGGGTNGGGTGGGTGGGSDLAHKKKKPYKPKLTFTQKPE